MDLKSTYNQIAGDYFKEHQSNAEWLGSIYNYLDTFISLLKPGSLVLDAGCGPGFHLKYLMQEGFKVIGIDFSERMIEIAKQETPKGDFKVMDVRDLSGLDEKFDGIFAHAVILHFSKKEANGILKNLKGKLNPGGYLSIAVKEIRSDREEEQVVVENDYGYEYQRFFSYYSMDEIKNYLKDLEMEVCYEDIIPKGRSRWIRVISRNTV